MPIKTHNLIKVIRNNKEKKLSASKIIESNPADLPVHSKLIVDKTKVAEIDTDYTSLNRGILETIHRKILSTKYNNKNIIELFPDIELAIQILVSSILSPKTMTDIHLNYKLEKNFELNPELGSDILDLVSTYMEEEYELTDELPDIVREALFTSGAAAYAVIPEAAVDEVINADILASYSMEDYRNRVDLVISSISEPKNFLNIETKPKVELKGNVSLEEFVDYLTSSSNIQVTDNANVLSIGKLKDKIRTTIIQKSIRKGNSISTESLDKVKYLDVFRERGNVTGNREIEFIKTKLETKRKSIGRPMVTKFPTESIIPVFSPGNVRDHVGYFVLLDNNGKPVSGDTTEEDLSRLDHLLHGNDGQLTPMQKAYKHLIATTNTNIDVNSLFDMYRTVLEKQLFNSVRSSLYGNSLEVSSRNDMYYLMFTRALMEQQTSVLFIPQEQMTYFAFQFSDIGVGKSLLENLAVQSSLRAILLFAKVMAYAKQAIDVTKVNVQLDPNDPDPEKTMEQVQSSVLKLRQNFLPLGINNPIDLVNWIQRAGLQFAYEGNNRLPDLKIEFDNNNLSHTLPDSDLEEELRKQSIIALGLPPETIDNGFSPEFARTVINNNILLSKRVTIYQKKLEKDTSKFIGLILTNDEALRGQLKELIISKLSLVEASLDEDEKQLLNKDKEAFIEYYLDELSDNVLVELPKPEDTDLTNLSEEFDTYSEALDKAIDSVISSDIFSENIAGEMEGHIDTMRNIWKHNLLRKWMSDNNFLPELLDFVDTDREDSDAVMQSISTHLVSTMRNSTKLLSLMKTFREATDKDIDRIFNGEDVDGADADGDDSSDSDDDGGDDFGDDEGFGDEDDMSGDELLEF